MLIVFDDQLIGWINFGLSFTDEPCTCHLYDDFRRIRAYVNSVRAIVLSGFNASCVKWELRLFIIIRAQARLCVSIRSSLIYCGLLTSNEHVRYATGFMYLMAITQWYSRVSSKVCFG